MSFRHRVRTNQRSLQFITAAKPAAMRKKRSIQKLGISLVSYDKLWLIADGKIHGSRDETDRMYSVMDCRCRLDIGSRSNCYLRPQDSFRKLASAALFNYTKANWAVNVAGDDDASI